MAAHGNSRRLVPLAAVVVCLVVAAAYGGYVMAGKRTPQAVNLTAAASGSGHGTTVYACLASGKLTRVSVAVAPKCPAKSVLVQWAAQSDPASSASPRPASKPAAKPAASSTPTAAAGTPAATPPSASGAACVKTADNGTCGPYDYAGITDSSSGDDTFVIQDEWNPIQGASQTLTAFSPGDWSVSADMPAANTAVVSYPDTQVIYTTTSDTPNSLSHFSSITSSFTESVPSGGDNEAAYDIWTGDAPTGNYAEEIMIWVDDHRTTTPLGTDLGTATFDGQTFQIWDSVAKGAKGTISFLLEGNETSGTVDVLSMLNYLARNGYIPGDSGLNQIDFGWEICSTGGVPETFTMSRYTIESSCASGSSCAG